MRIQAIRAQIVRGFNSSLLRTSVISAVLKAVFSVLGFATTILLARALGPSGLGVYTLVLTVMMFAALPAKAGMPQIVVRETAKALTLARFDLVKGVWSWAATFVISTSILIGTVGFITYLLYKEAWGPELSTTILLGLALVPLYSAGELRSACLRGLGHVIVGQIPELLIRPALMVVALLVVAALGYAHYDARFAMGVYVSACAISFVIGTILLWQRRVPDVMSARSTKLSRDWVRATIPMAATNIFFLANTQIDILLIAFFLNSENVGLYRVAVQGSLLIVFGLQATKMVVEPRFSKLYASGDIVSLNRLARRISRFNLAVALAVLAVLVLFADWVIPIAFGSEFSPAAGPLIILCAGRLVGAVVGSSGHLLNMTGFERQYARIWLAAAGMTLILNIITIPLYGIYGAASSTAIGLASANLAGWYLAKRRIGCDCSPFKFS